MFDCDSIYQLLADVVSAFYALANMEQDEYYSDDEVDNEVDNEVAADTEVMTMTHDVVAKSSRYESHAIMRAAKSEIYCGMLEKLEKQFSKSVSMRKTYNSKGFQAVQISCIRRYLRRLICGETNIIASAAVFEAVFDDIAGMGNQLLARSTAAI